VTILNGKNNPLLTFWIENGNLKVRNMVNGYIEANFKHLRCIVPSFSISPVPSVEKETETKG
jgi:hypothetical protein